MAFGGTREGTVAAQRVATGTMLEFLTGVTAPAGPLAERPAGHQQ